MITPRENLELRTERPPLECGALVRLLRPLGGLFRCLYSRDDEPLNAKLQTLLSDVSECADSTQIESLLGQPDYAMVGDHFGTTTPDDKTIRPDSVECYSVGRLNVELWFRDGQLSQTIGYLMPTAWDFVVGD